MEEVRKIIREELHALSEEELGNHPFFDNPEKLYEYAMEWAEKANKLRHFHLLVGNILWEAISPEEKISRLQELFKQFAGV